MTKKQTLKDLLVKRQAPGVINHIRNGDVGCCVELHRIIQAQQKWIEELRGALTEVVSFAEREPEILTCSDCDEYFGPVVGKVKKALSIKPENIEVE